MGAVGFHEHLVQANPSIPPLLSFLFGPLNVTSVEGPVLSPYCPLPHFTLLHLELTCSFTACLP